MHGNGRSLRFSCSHLQFACMALMGTWGSKYIAAIVITIFQSVACFSLRTDSNNWVIIQTACTCLMKIFALIV